MGRRVLVLGSGPAALHVALKLQQHGCPVTVLEQDGQPAVGGDDEGGDLLWGWQGRTLSLLGGLPAPALGPPAHLSLLRSDGRRVGFPTWAPGPARLLAVALFRGLPIRDRWRLLDSLERRWEGGVPMEPPDGEPAWDWLESLGQSPASLGALWEPLGRFLIGEGLRTLSAAALAQVLRTAFLTSRRHSRLWLASFPVRRTLVDRLRTALARLGTTFVERTPVVQVCCESQTVVGLQLADGGRLSADWYVLALPWRALTALLPERAVTRFSYFHQLEQLVGLSVVSVEGQATGRSARPQILLLGDGPFHSLVVRPDRGSVRLALVWTGDAPPPDDELRRMAAPRLDRLSLGLGVGAPVDLAVRRRSDSPLALRPGTAALRPLPQSPFRNCLLAGGWTDTGLPPGLESDLSSGERCAEIILGKA